MGWALHPATTKPLLQTAQRLADAVRFNVSAGMT
jgi:hypothetical protein